ncbi:hypothetical protein [Pseudodesulfovibrio portus]|uniref:Uncharacterized protein n=1 Tax=Pseudodesulfovibrio portus TaxID=231439 RepID=A0ABM8AQ51_9BACT|nr:hypothetical protein [Pseudodesulfovibrio portus]BDQ33445.1 hypothetical protein JCM14722_09870 [Pseudodesulfovibrio portus]
MEPITTQYGQLIPQHTTDDLRKRDLFPVEYHRSGVVKSVPLEAQTPIDTPAGTVPAELVSFHENGNINRIFPLNGKLCGYWSQEDEAALAAPVTLNTPVGIVTARILSLGFFDNRSLRSITLWPEDTLTIASPVGMVETRIGVSFAPDGSIRSLEPARPTPIKTLAGEIMAYDPDAVGVNGDVNSLVFDHGGNVVRVATTLTRLTAISPDGRTTAFAPEQRESLCSESEQEVVPMVIGFGKDAVTVQTDPDGPVTRIPREGHVFFAEPFLPQLSNPFAGLRCSV